MCLTKNSFELLVITDKAGGYRSFHLDTSYVSPEMEIFPGNVGTEGIL